MDAMTIIKLLKKQTGTTWEQLGEATNTCGGRKGMYKRASAAKEMRVMLFAELCALMGCEVIVRPRKEYNSTMEFVLDEGTLVTLEGLPGEVYRNVSKKNARITDKFQPLESAPTPAIQALPNPTSISAPAEDFPKPEEPLEDLEFHPWIFKD